MTRSMAATAERRLKKSVASVSGLMKEKKEKKKSKPKLQSQQAACQKSEKTQSRPKASVGQEGNYRP